MPPEVQQKDRKQGYCKAWVPHEGRMPGGRQCSRKHVKDGWCTQHHPDSVAARDVERVEYFRLEDKYRRLKNELVVATDSLVLTCEEYVTGKTKAHNIKTQTVIMQHARKRKNDVYQQLIKHPYTATNKARRTRRF